MALVERLRKWPGLREGLEAADRIEALEKALREIQSALSSSDHTGTPEGIYAIARAALKEE